MRKSEAAAISLGGDGGKLSRWVFGGRSRDPHLMAWQEILNNTNFLSEDEDFDPGSVESWVQGGVAILVQNEEIEDQDNANTKERFRQRQTPATAFTKVDLTTKTASKPSQDS